MPVRPYGLTGTALRAARRHITHMVLFKITLFILAYYNIYSQYAHALFRRLAGLSNQDGQPRPTLRLHNRRDIPLSFLFFAGIRIFLQIISNNFPLYAQNYRIFTHRTGDHPFAKKNAASHTIYAVHDQQRAFFAFFPKNHCLFNILYDFSSKLTLLFFTKET